MFARKNRNPCLGELTPRDDAEFLVPFAVDKPKQQPTLPSAAESLAIRNKVRAKLQNLSNFEAIKLRKERIEFEIKALKKVAAYDKVCLGTMPTGAI